jgi:type I restriction enzyme M protein
MGWNLSPRGARTSRATGPRAARGRAATDPAQASATTNLEPKLWQAADMLRNNMDAAEYKHIVLGLIFLKYISDAFESKHAELAGAAAAGEGADPEDPDEYKAASIFWVPREARWSHLKASAPQPTIGRTVDDAMDAIERENPTLKGVLPKDFGRPGLDKARLAQLINLVSDIGLGSPADRAKDILGRVYEYFLAQFASAEGKKGGQFYTPSRVVRVLVEMLAPYKGRVYDPCCGSGGMFVSSEKFIEEHRGRVGDISIYGQESNYTTWHLANMNLAIRGIGANIAQGDSFHADAFPDLKADYVLANPPFNDSDWRGELLRNDKRWVYGMLAAGNAGLEDGDLNGGKGRPVAGGRPACSRRQPTVDGLIRSAGTSGIARSLPQASFTAPLAGFVLANGHGPMARVAERISGLRPVNPSWGPP